MRSACDARQALARAAAAALAARILLRNIGTLIVRIGFRGILYYRYSKETPRAADAEAQGGWK